MADGDPEVDLDLDPPVDETEGEDHEEQDQQVEEQEDEPEGESTEEATGQDRQTGSEQRQQPRGNRQFGELRRGIRERDQQISDLNRRLDALIAGRTQPAPQGETPEARAQRMALLTPEERIREELQVAQQGFAREQQQLRFTVLDGNDRAAFEAKATVDPLYQKWKPKVEAELQVLRQQGMNADREKIMFYLIGKSAVEGRLQTRGQQRAAGAQRVQRQTTRPSNSGSDVQARRDRNSSLERRLENQSL